jgi:hypothetical protein
MINDVQWFVGIDWATQSHRVCLLDVEGRHVKERDFAHGGAGLTELRDWLLEKTAGAPGQIAVAIETPHGPVVEMLLDHEFQVFAINPKQLDRFRDRFTVAGAKDDSRDAHVLGAIRICPALASPHREPPAACRGSPSYSGCCRTQLETLAPQGGGLRFRLPPSLCELRRTSRLTRLTTATST